MKNKIIPICFMILAGFLAINNLDYWGWCILLAALTTT